MRVRVRGTGLSGEPIDTEVDVPSTVRNGDAFVFGSEDDAQELEIVGMEKHVGPDGVPVSTVHVAPFPGYYYEEVPEE